MLSPLITRYGKEKVKHFGAKVIQAEAFALCFV